MILSPVSFPSLALNLPEGGRSTTYQRYTLWSKEDIGNAPNRQFRVDVLGYGADVSILPITIEYPRSTNQNLMSKTLPIVTSLNPTSTYIIPGLPNPDYNSLIPKDVFPSYIQSVAWETYGGYGKQDFSLVVKPTLCGFLNTLPTPWASWEEVVSKTPACAQYAGDLCVAKPWDKKWNTSVYWSMHNQYVCHSDWAKWQGKFDAFHLEPRRPDKGYKGLFNGFATPQNSCN
jgi:Protein of unknown function (DUF2599)